MTNPQNLLKSVQLHQQAKQLHAAGQHAAAADAFQKALALVPHNPLLIADYARLAEDVKDWAGAEKLYRRLLAVKPDAACEAWLGHVLFRQGRFADALPFLQIQIERGPPEPDLLLMAGLSASKLKQWDDVIAVGKQLDAVRSNEKSLDLIINGLFNLGRRDELHDWVEQAIRRYPDQPELMGLCGVHLLKCGEFRRGFGFQRAIRWRYDAGRPAQFQADPEHYWDGQPFAGTLLIAGEQGLGEEILASCMLGDVIARGQRMVVECEPRLLPLFRRSWPGIDFVPRYAGELDRLAASGGIWRRIKCLDLAEFFRRQEPLPMQAPWLIADPERSKALRADYQARFPGRKLVGISWRSKREFHNGPGKSIPVTALAPLLARSDVAVVNVQYGDCTSDLAELDAAGIPRPWQDPAINASDDIDALAAQLAALDQVVSVSNTTVHLAGAIGTPCLVLLPKSRPVLWYWGYQADTAPWYPSLQMLRNRTEDNWQAVIAQAVERVADAGQTST